VVVCQTHWRGFVTRRKYFVKVQERNTAATLIQESWRNLLLRRMTAISAAISIQRIWRGYIGQVLYHMDVMDIILVQCLVRKKIAERRMRQRIHAASVIHRLVATFLTRKKLDFCHAQMCAVIMCQVSTRCTNVLSSSSWTCRLTCLMSPSCSFLTRIKGVMAWISRAFAPTQNATFCVHCSNGLSSPTREHALHNFAQLGNDYSVDLEGVCCEKEV